MAKYATGSKYEGEFVKNQYHGKGTYISPTGTIINGKFKKGEFVEDKNKKLSIN